MNISKKSIVLMCAGLSCIPLMARASDLIPYLAPSWSIQEDVDQDGLRDEDEILLGLNPFDSADGLSDVDGDGLPLSWEFDLGTDPYVADTDVDGWSDFEETMIYATDPVNPASLPEFNRTIAQTVAPSDELSTASAVNSVTALSSMQASLPKIGNGSFSDHLILIHPAKASAVDYRGRSFAWGQGFMDQWEAYAGYLIEVWEADGHTFVELDAAKGSYGIKQEIKNVQQGGYFLQWKSLARNNPKAGDNSYTVKVYYKQNQEEVVIAKLNPSSLNQPVPTGAKTPADLVIADLSNPTGPLAKAITQEGLDIFVEISDLKEISDTTEGVQDYANYRKTEWKFTVSAGNQEIERKGRLYRGGFWLTEKQGNEGTIGFYDGIDNSDKGVCVHGPYKMYTGIPPCIDETTKDIGPTPVGKYSITKRYKPSYEKVWKKDHSPQVDYDVDEKGNKYPGEHWKLGSYCKWPFPNRDTHDFEVPSAKPDMSIKFKYDLTYHSIGGVTINRTNLQIHPDGNQIGTGGCIGIDEYFDCCNISYYLTNYYGCFLIVQ